MRKPPCSQLVARRVFAFPAVFLLGGAGCATGASANRNISALEEEVGSLRRERQQDQKRIEALENQFDAQQAELAKLRGDAPTSSQGDVPPQLPVTRLARHGKPLKSLPPVPTSVAVREPDSSDLAALDDAVGHERRTAASGEADVLFQQAFEKLKIGDLAGAAVDFQSFAKNYPKNDAADNALLDQGIALYGQHRYEDALTVFSRVEARYPAGDAVPEALWRAADCETQLGKNAEAKKRLAHLAQSYPESPEGARAHDKLGNGNGLTMTEVVP